MAYTELEARQQLLDGLARAIDELGQALSSIGAAYELLDEQQGDRLEERLFRPLQRAYGRAQRGHAEFANRYGLTGREFTAPPPGAPSTGVRGFIQEAVDAVGRADLQLVGLQDSDMAIDVGDTQLRAALTEVRQLIDGLTRAAREFVRSFGR